MRKVPRARPNARRVSSKRLKRSFLEIELVSTDQYAGATRDTAKRASENLLNRFSDEVQGIFTPNESSTAGMLLALQDIGKAGKISFVGFDSSQVFIDALNGDQLHGIVVQNPFNMGYLGVRTMVASLPGTTVEQKIDTGVMLVTKDNMISPEVQALLHPPLDQYLEVGHGFHGATQICQCRRVVRVEVREWLLT